MPSQIPNSKCRRTEEKKKSPWKHLGTILVLESNTCSKFMGSLKRLPLEEQDVCIWGDFSLGEAFAKGL